MRRRDVRRADIEWDWQSNPGIGRVDKVTAEVSEVWMMAPASNSLRLRTTCVA